MKDSTDKIINIDLTLVTELFKDLDKIYHNYNLGEMERMWLSTMYAIEKQSYVTIRQVKHFDSYQKKLNRTEGI